MTVWEITSSYLSGMPPTITTRTNNEFYREAQKLADEKAVRKDRPPIGRLEFEEFTDQIDVYFIRNGKRIRFLTAMATG